ncbi:MAG: preprotein translocase subunit SecE [Chthoniobacteraceae bacterium]|nr:preprotein translocase subunit SecE [Chthoniobacteraceae bacterium]
MLARTKTFISEVRGELAKASWPWDPKEKGFKKYKELVDSTIVVVIAMLLLSGYVALLDFVLLYVVGALTGGSWSK